MQILFDAFPTSLFSNPLFSLFFFLFLSTYVIRGAPIYGGGTV